MPVNARYPLADVLAACQAHYERKRRKVFVEYVMLAGVNDGYVQAAQLAEALDPRVYKVNLIPYNPTDSPYEGSSPKAIDAFRASLEARGLDATVRLTRGRDIDAACGQLAARAQHDRGHALARAIAAGRLGFGVALLAAPERGAGPWLGRRDARRAATVVAVRGLGARDLALGAGALAASPEALPGWVAAAVLGDLTDLVATLTAGDGVPASGRVLVGGLAASAVAFGAVALAGLRAGVAARARALYPPGAAPARASPARSSRSRRSSSTSGEGSNAAISGSWSSALSPNRRRKRSVVRYSTAPN